MTTPTLREIVEELMFTLETSPTQDSFAKEKLAKARAALAAQPELPEPTGYFRAGATLPGYGGWMICRKTDAQAEPFYTAAQLQQAVEQAKPVDGESVLVDGAAYEIPAPVAVELLRLNIELKQAQAKREPMTREQLQEIFLANGFTVKEGQDDLKDYVYAAGRAIEAHRSIGGGK